VPDLKFVSLVNLELLAFNAPKIMGSRDPDHAPLFEKICQVTTGVSVGACVPNLKFVPLETFWSY